TAGNEAFERYEGFFGTQESGRFLRYVTPHQARDVRLEDFLSQSDQERIMNVTGANSVKAAYAQLFHGPVRDQTDILSGLDHTTSTNLSLVWNRLRGLADASVKTESV